MLLLFSRSILSVRQSHDTHLSSLLLWILAYSQYSALGFQFFLKIWFHGHNILFDCRSTGSQLLARSTCRSTAYHIHFKRQVHHFPGIRRDLTRHNSRRHPVRISLVIAAEKSHHLRAGLIGGFCGITSSFQKEQRQGSVVANRMLRGSYRIIECQ